MKSIGLLVVKWLVTTTSFLLILALCIIGVSLFASYHTGQWHWFQRSGALLVSIGAILSTRRLLRVGLDGLMLGSSYFEIAAGMEANQNASKDLQSKHDLISAYYGFVVVALGTIVWAYGDLIECLVAQNMGCVL